MSRLSSLFWFFRRSPAPTPREAPDNLPEAPAPAARPSVEERLDGLCGVMREKTEQGRLVWEREGDDDENVVFRVIVNGYPIALHEPPDGGTLGVLMTLGNRRGRVVEEHRSAAVDDLFVAVRTSVSALDHAIARIMVHIKSL